jgi:hypothetical protein
MDGSGPKTPTAPTEKNEELEKVCTWFEDTYKLNYRVSNVTKQLQKL